MNTEEKRMFGDYEVIQSVHFGQTEIIVGESKYKEPKYVCCDIERSGLLQFPTNDIYDRKYLEIMKEFAKRISDRVSEIEKTAPKDSKIITAEQCIPVNDFKNLTGKVVVIAPDNIKREYQNERNQLIYVTGGNGARLNAMGNGVFGYNLSTKEHVRWERYDLLGVIKDEAMPEWAKEGLAEVKKMITDRSREEAR
ncbi:MAG: hypothetical protein J5964_02315 [Eubacterium sp.]|nr:hypothetical protein [Eubacterium sp.]